MWRGRSRRNEPKWNGWGKWVKKVSDGPIGRGTMFHGDTSF